MTSWLSPDLESAILSTFSWSESPQARHLLLEETPVGTEFYD